MNLHKPIYWLVDQAFAWMDRRTMRKMLEAEIDRIGPDPQNWADAHRLERAKAKLEELNRKK